MKIDLDKLWELVDEMLQHHETEQEEGEEQYHEGWCDAMRWLLDILEPSLHNEIDDEW